MKHRALILASIAAASSTPATAQEVLMRRPLGDAGVAAAPAQPHASQATSIRAVGTQVMAAGLAFMRATGRVPSSDADLVPTYLAAMPSTGYASQQGWAYYAVGARALFQLSVPDEDDCRAINRDAANGFGYAIIPPGAERGVDEGCYRNDPYGLIYVRWYSL